MFFTPSSSQYRNSCTALARTYSMSARGEQKKQTFTTADLLKRQRKKTTQEQQRDLGRDTHTEVDYLDSIFDDASLETEVLELTRGGYSSESFNNMRAFGPRDDSEVVLKEIKVVRHLQQEIYHEHLAVELQLNEFVEKRSRRVSKAEASAKFCENFREAFAKKKNAMEGVSEKLSQLADSVDKVNNLVGKN